jgi:hypothetical protein
MRIPVVFRAGLVYSPIEGCPGKNMWPIVMTQGRKKRSSKINTGFSDARFMSYAKVSLVKSSNSAEVLSKLRSQLPMKLFPELLAWLRKAPKLASRTLCTPYPFAPNEWKSL